MSSLISSIEGDSAESGMAFDAPFGIHENAAIILQKSTEIYLINAAKLGSNYE